MSHSNFSHLPMGTPRGAQKSNPVSVPKFAMDFSEPAYCNNKVGDNIFKLQKLCSQRCQICPMLDVDASIITSTVNKRKYPVLTNENQS